MENNTVGKKLVDIVTIALLFIAFAVAFVMGFIVKNSYGQNLLNTTVVFLVSVVGLGILYASGTVTELIGRIKRKEMTKGFVILFTACTVIYIAMAAIMLALACRLTTTAAFLPRFIFILGTVAIITGYAFSAAYSAKVEAETAEVTDGEPEEEEQDAE